MHALSQVIGKSLDDAAAKKARWTDLVLAKEKKEQAFASTTSSSGLPNGTSGTETKDFSSSAAAAPQQEHQRPSTAGAALDSASSSTSVADDPTTTTTADLDRQPSAIARKPLTPQAFSPPPVNSAGPPRSRTPPMSARSGGRSRDAVRSMIF